jgi:hypothetical protein
MKVKMDNGNTATVEPQLNDSPPRLWAVLRKKDMSLVGVRPSRARARALKQGLERGKSKAISKFTVKSYSVDL